MLPSEKDNVAKNVYHIFNKMRVHCPHEREFLVRLALRKAIEICSLSGNIDEDLVEKAYQESLGFWRRDRSSVIFYSCLSLFCGMFSLSIILSYNMDFSIRARAIALTAFVACLIVFIRNISNQ
jgi:hypothetical protein